ncbi:MAG: amidohydrolase family protein [Chitinophagales bacterium]
MRRLAADIIFPVSTPPVLDSVLLLSDEEKIIGIHPRADFLDSEIEIFHGALVPGFVNTHCHLELSHLKNVLPQKTGLIDFLSEVPSQRLHSDEVILAAIEEADNEMWKEGIVAVGDISNNDISFAAKAKSKIHFHTFIELLALDTEKASAVFDKGLQLLQQARSMGLHTSLAPHAPYTVSTALMQLIFQHCYTNSLPTTLHFLESAEENVFFKNGTGGFRQLYANLQLPLRFTPTNKLCVESVLPNLHPQVRTLLVHNTYASYYDVAFAENIHPHIFWCVCPNANLYIENRLPDVSILMQNVRYITIGTDSLASNHTLSVMEELKTLQKHFPQLTAETLIRWATLYGAKFLNLQETLGSFDTGKKPGVVLLRDYNPANGSLRNCSPVRIA